MSDVAAFAEVVLRGLLRCRATHDLAAARGVIGQIFLAVALSFDDFDRRPVVDRRAFAAVLAARNAAIEGDAAGVDAFSRDWLGLSDPARWREAVENALLGDWVHHLGRGSLDDAGLLKLLHRHAAVEHRHLRPLWERRCRGRRSVLLSRPIGRDMLVGDLLADRCGPEEEVLARELTDSRLAAVLRGLTRQEAEVALAWAADPRTTWSRAAALVGHPDPGAFGERVRRKAKRIGARHTARARAAAALPRPA
ncbi:hypothetical protein ACFV1L_07545 [Kitasatospora sp. NPDC059646]|uniref:hypothetical protein n=1 Tax=Kitasatospora sp. NPDC059646 TaxID=3346893 RepID=UPI0036C11AAC